MFYPNDDVQEVILSTIKEVIDVHSIKCFFLLDNYGFY